MCKGTYRKAACFFLYLACNVAKAFEEIWRGVVISTFSLNWLNHNPSNRLAPLSPLDNQIFHLKMSTKHRFEQK